jgi:DNA primase
MSFIPNKGGVMNTPRREFDNDALNAIPIDEVLEHYQLESIGRGKFICPNNHKSKAKVEIYSDKNICKCFNCGEFQGGPISIAKWFFNGDYVAACNDLHDVFGIPFKQGSTPAPALDESINAVLGIKVRAKTIVKPVVKLIEFDESKQFDNIDINQFLPQYAQMSDSQKYQVVMTAVYLFSRKTDLSRVNAYHQSRGLEGNHYTNLMGYLSRSDIFTLCEKLELVFPVEDLIAFKIYSDWDSKRPGQWKWMPTEEGLIVVPSFNFYNNLVNGFRFRSTSKEAWFKETEISRSDLIEYIPFGISPMVLRKKNLVINITEGYPDGIALDRPFFMIPGANRWRDEWCGFLKNVSQLNVWFDADEAGQKGLEKLHASIKEYAPHVTVKTVTWDEALGKDANELLQNGNLDSVLSKNGL